MSFMDHVTIHMVSVILSVAKDLGRICTADEILRYAQDDSYLTGCERLHGLRRRARR